MLPNSNNCRNPQLETLLREVLGRMSAGNNAIERILPVNEKDRAGDLLPPPLAAQEEAPMCVHWEEGADFDDEQVLTSRLPGCGSR